MCFIDTVNKVHRAPGTVNKAHSDGFKKQKSWNLEILRFNIIKSGFYCTNLEQINSRKLLNLLFK